MLDANALDHAFWCFANFKFNPLVSNSVTKALWSKIHAMINPTYQMISKAHAILLREPPVLNMDKLIFEVEKYYIPIVCMLSQYTVQAYWLGFAKQELHRDTVLIVKLLRVFKEYFVYKNNALQNLPIVQSLFEACFLIDCVPNISYELWELMQIMPYAQRFQVYGAAADAGYQSHFKFKAVYNATLQEVKRNMKRLSDSSIQERGKVLGKLSHSNPIILAKELIDKVEKYDNMIIPIVESLKHVTTLTLDVHVWASLQYLANPQHAMLKEDGTSIAQYLTNISSFLAKLIKKYATIDIEPVLHYCVNSMKQGRMEEMIIIRDIIKDIGQLGLTDDLSLSQIDANAGGDVLRVSAGGESVFPRQSKKSLQQLVKILFENATLGQELLFYIARLRGYSMFIHDEGDLDASLLKLVTDTHDKTHETLLYYLRFIQEQCFVVLEGAEKVADKKSDTSKTVFVVPSLRKMLELKIDMETATAIVRSGTNFRCPTSLRSEFGSFDDITPQPKYLLPAMNHLFWSMELYDLHLPTKTYEEQLAKFKEGKTETKKWYNPLEKEFKSQKEHHERLQPHLNQLKNSLMPEASPHASIIYFVQFCLLPRVFFSTSDSLYCVKFIETLKALDTPHFNLPFFVTTVIQTLPVVLASCTEAEENRFSKFLRNMLPVFFKMLDKETYNKECTSKNMFFNYIKNTQLTHAEYVEMMNKSLNQMTSAMLPLLDRANSQSKHVVNVLNSMSEFFPHTKDMATMLEPAIEKLATNKDLKAIATGYQNTLNEAISRLPEEKAKIAKAKAQLPALPKPEEVKKDEKRESSSRRDSDVKSRDSRRSRSRSTERESSSRRNSDTRKRSPESKKREREHETERKPQETKKRKTESSSDSKKHESSSNDKKKEDSSKKDSDKQQNRSTSDKKKESNGVAHVEPPKPLKDKKDSDKQQQATEEKKTSKTATPPSTPAATEPVKLEIKLEKSETAEQASTTTQQQHKKSKLVRPTLPEEKQEK